MLIYKRANVAAKNASGATPLLLAAAQWSGRLTNDQETTLELLSESPNIELNEQAGFQKRTALLQAAALASPSAVRVLVEKGADCFIRDSNGKTARDLASGIDESQWGDEKAEILAFLSEKK